MKPQINVTPLIDVLLVLLIIFMVISPLKQSRFKALIPEFTPNSRPLKEPLLVRINENGTLQLNESSLGTIENPEKLLQRLRNLLDRQTDGKLSNLQPLPSKSSSAGPRVNKTVFISAPRGIPYGKVVGLIDILKQAGAEPIGLLMDRSDQANELNTIPVML